MVCTLPVSSYWRLPWRHIGVSGQHFKCCGFTCAVYTKKPKTLHRTFKLNSTSLSSGSFQLKEQQYGLQIIFLMIPPPLELLHIFCPLLVVFCACMSKIRTQNTLVLQNTDIATKYTKIYAFYLSTSGHLLLTSLELEGCRSCFLLCKCALSPELHHHLHL